MDLRVCFPSITFAALCLLTPCLAGEFGQTQQLFAQYGIGGPAETAFTIHHQGAGEILVVVDLISPDGTLFLSQDVALGPGATETIVFNDPPRIKSTLAMPNHVDSIHSKHLHGAIYLS